MTMRTKRYAAVTLPALDTDGLAAAQQLAGSGSLVLNGVLSSGAAATFSPATTIDVTSAGNIATVVFTIYGTDSSNVAITDTVTGVNANTVATTKSFKTVTRVATSAIVGSNVTVGDTGGDADGIAAAQTTGGAADLVLNGADMAGGTWSSSFAHQLGVYSAGNIATVVFTITGTDQDGKAQTETVTGVNAGTVETTKYFKTVSSITADAAVGSDVIVGTVDEISFPTIPVNIYNRAHTVAVDVTGTLNYDLEETFARPTAGETVAWQNDADIVNETTSQNAYIQKQLGAFRIVVNSYTAGATLAYSINPEWC